MLVIWYVGHSREAGCCDGLEKITVVLHYLFSVLYCSDPFFFLHRERHKKTVEELSKFFSKGRADPLAIQMLPLWDPEGRNTARIACSGLETSGGAVESFVITAELQHRTYPVQIGSDDYTTDLASAEGHNVFGSLIYRMIRVRRNQEGNCYVSVSSLYCLQDTWENFWLNIFVVEKEEPA